MSESTHQCGGCGGCGSETPAAEPKLAAHALSQIKTVIAVAGGKGGTGKSLVTGLLAVELTKRGKQVAILDADIQAPAISEMFDLPQGVTKGDEGLYPGISTGGIKVMSVGLLLEQETDTISWYGAVMAGVVQKLWSTTLWDQVDCLLIDLPPDMGDVTLGALEHLPLDGLLLVSTPQAAANRAMGRTLLLAGEKQVPVLGFIENFAGLFHGNALEDLAARYQLPILDQLSYDPILAEAADEGKLESLGTSYLSKTVARIETL